MEPVDVADAGKRALRAEMRRVRAAIGDRDERAQRIWPQVVAHCRRIGAGTVMAFIGIGTEPDTSAVVEHLVADGFRVVLPRVEGDRIVAVDHDPGDTLAAGAFGTCHPHGPAIDPTVIDVVLVPGLAFTRDGRRLGQGGGFYDRFLPLVGDGCTTIGICFEDQIVDDLTTVAHDRKVDIVVTDAVPE